MECKKCKLKISKIFNLPIKYEPLKINKSITSLCGSEYVLKQYIPDYDRKDYICSEPQITFLKYSDLNINDTEDLVNFCSNDCIFQFIKENNNKYFIITKSESILKLFIFLNKKNQK